MKETKDKIIEKALEYFSTHDYERTSLNVIAKELNVTKGAIYHYFGSKDELFKETVLYIMNKLEELFFMMAKANMNFKELLKAWFSITVMMEDSAKYLEINVLNDYSNYIYLLFASIKKFPEIRNRIDTIYSKLISVLIDMFKSAQETGEIKASLDTEALAFEVAAFGEGTLLLNSVVSNINIKDLSERTFYNFWERIKR